MVIATPALFLVAVGAAPPVAASTPPRPTLVPGLVSVTPSTGQTVAEVPITLSAVSTGDVTVSWSTIDPAGSAPTADYVAASGTLTIPAGTTEAEVPITVLNDSTDTREDVVVSFTDPSGAQMGGHWGLGEAVIEPGPTIEPGSAAVTAPTTGTAEADVPVTLSAASTKTITADWTTIHASTDGLLGDAPEAPTTHYQPASGTVTFAPGQTTATVPVQVTGETANPFELILVSFTNPTNANMGGVWGLGGVYDYPSPTVNFPSEPQITYTQPNPSTYDAQLPITLSRPATDPVTVTWITDAPLEGNGGIFGCSDISPSSATVTFPPGTTTEYVNTTFSCSPSVADGHPINGYYAFFVLNSATNAVIGNGYYTVGISP